MSTNKTIYMKEKENPPRRKETHSTLTVTISSEDPELQKSIEKIKPPTLKFPMPLVQKIEGPFDINGNLVKELVVGEIYTYKATRFKDSTFTPIKHIWFAEQLDDGKITDLEYKKGENPYLDKEGIVCFKYTVKECEKVRIYAYVAKPIKPVSIECKVTSKKVIALFIGGAGDKESYYGAPASKIMERTKRSFFKKLNIYKNIKKNYIDIYLGYNEARGDDDIQNKIIANIPNKENTAIYIIGHSLGGWNGAHLSQILTDKGYNVDLLITLDPVGVGSTVTYISDIYWTTPKPKANYWINISTSPKNYEADDFIADLGGQWKPKKGMQINDECDCNHRSASHMLNKPLKDTNISASDMLIHYIKLFFKK